jgi:hypothetical protein
MKRDAFFVAESDLPFQAFELLVLELLEHSTVHQERSRRPTVVGIHKGE